MAEKYYVHGDAITNVSFDKGVIQLDMERYNDELDAYIPYAMTFYGVTEIKIDHVLSADIKLIFEYGDILRLQVTDHSVKLIVEWINFKPKQQQTNLYEFLFDRMEASGVIADGQ